MSYEAAVEIREAILELNKELKLVRLGLNALTALFADVVDQGAGSYPGHIRTRTEQ